MPNNFNPALVSNVQAHADLQKRAEGLLNLNHAVCPKFSTFLF